MAPTDDAPAGNVPSPRQTLSYLRRLFQAWCKALLYPGPRCECGCDPHGVVIGCAVVESGTIGMVDPWEYRNHVRFTLGRKYGDVGYTYRESHRLLRVDHCYIAHPAINEVLAVVHRRDDARDLVRAMDAVVPGTVHLSALMSLATARQWTSAPR